MNGKLSKSPLIKYSAFLLIFILWIGVLPPSPKADEMEAAYRQGKWSLGRHSATTFHYSTNDAQGRIYSAKNLFDSNRLTIWMTEPSRNPDWVIVDFGEKRLLNRVELEFPSWGESDLKYEIQVNVWGEWKSILVSNHAGRFNVHDLNPMDASMVRIYFPKTRKTSTAMSDLRIYLGDSLLTGTESRLTKNRFPIRNGIIPDTDFSLPGAPRAYRNGYHKGIDIYEIQDTILGPKERLTFDTDILSIQKGKIIRLDRNYTPMTPGDFERQRELTKIYPVTFVDRDFGGRQVWIDHGNGIISAYNHLSSIREDLRLGQLVKKGEPIGKAGNSGLRQEADKSEENIHLHLEIWIDGEYMGYGLNPDQSRELLRIFFHR